MDKNLELPPNGTHVIASTYPSLEYDREAEEVEGILFKRYVPALNYIQCWVGGVQVDPATVRALSNS